MKPPPGDGGLVRYLAATSPQNVLQNLVSSYTSRDSVETAAVYDSAYVGTTIDPSAPTPTPAFSRADEIRHVGRLKLDPNIVSVTIDLGLPSSWQRMSASPSDPADWAAIQITGNTIRIEDARTATSWESRNTTMEFVFKPTVAAPGDTTWTIVRWNEMGN